jgi:hypothetical protein
LEEYKFICIFVLQKDAVSINVLKCKVFNLNKLHLIMRRIYSNRIKKGDVICAVRWGGAYLHYGIYVGGNNVIHFATENPNDYNVFHAKIIRTSLEVFADGADAYVEKEREGAKSGTETVKCAKSYLGTGLGKYNLLLNNCEHFANMCKYGKRECNQIYKVVLKFGLARVAPFSLWGKALLFEIEKFVYDNILKKEVYKKIFID